jgi:hypothetical protein
MIAVYAQRRFDIAGMTRTRHTCKDDVPRLSDLFAGGGRRDGVFGAYCNVDATFESASGRRPDRRWRADASPARSRRIDARHVPAHPCTSCLVGVRGQHVRAALFSETLRGRVRRASQDAGRASFRAPRGGRAVTASRRQQQQARDALRMRSKRTSDDRAERMPYQHAAFDRRARRASRAERLRSPPPAKAGTTGVETPYPAHPTQAHAASRPVLQTAAPTTPRPSQYHAAARAATPRRAQKPVRASR